MKILIVGGTGLIGGAVVKELAKRHQIIIASYSQGDIQVDITNKLSIEKMFTKIGKFDALICTAGKVIFENLTNMTAEKFHNRINDKLMGQVNLVLSGLKHINMKGSFTLTSGILNHDPIYQGSAAALVNGALEGFVKATAIELEQGVRINLISPTVVTEALPHYESYFRGFVSVAAAEVALAYSKSVEGMQTGQIYRIGY